MRRFILLTALLFAATIANAQDIIVLNNTDEIEAKVTSITQDEVSYKRWSNIEGPTYTINKTEVFYIKYQNGEKDIITTQENQVAENVAQTTTPEQPAKVTSPLTPIKFRAYTNLGTIFLASGAGPTVDLTAGVQIYEHLYAGVTTGFHSLLIPYYDDWEEESGVGVVGYVPLGVNLKGYLTRGRTVNPYLNCTLGGFFEVSDNLSGFLCQVGAGVEIKRFTIGIGYNAMIVYGLRLDMGYVNLGFRIGK